jgi:hypothetical protein
VADNAGHNFDRGKHDIDEQAKQRDTRGGLQNLLGGMSFRWHR